jgi:ketosteroid isomerase-like protein
MPLETFGSIFLRGHRMSKFSDWLRLAILPLMSVSICASAAQSSTGTSGQSSGNEAEVSRLTAASEQWITDVNSKDVARGIAGMTADAAIIAPDGTQAQGREQLVGYVSKLVATPGFHVEFKPDSVSLSIDGNVGYVTGKSVISFAMPDGQMQTRDGRLLTVWRKSDDGKWLCYLDVVMGNP